ncbi:heterodisulfide reductase [candidate division KSB3 bacterium]|uniref:Heterodisulfide reductase n=1 Tax=candidate division KSB3 bacterium TaxID=2044937 RepID=A0A9D5JZX3_9BACT|nr:heterodisulfide reductase [candidate division KSB3 bacterium]MBD3326861.1 heterodisulfide reductase [candidate division KSB3 bacterium]
METITLTKLDPNFKFELAEKPGAENIRKCYACGTCTAGCPVFHVEHKYNPRKIIRMILLGMREEVLKSKIIWLCAQCYVCSANCPQDVDFSNIMISLRDMAVKEGYAPPDLVETIEDIGAAAHAIRRDCIHRLLGDEEVSKDQIRANLEHVLENS